MAVRVSRRKLAGHVAEQLSRGSTVVIDELAAFLVQNRRTNEVDLIVRDIEDQLALRGLVVATVVSAEALSPTSRKEVMELIHDRYGKDAKVTLREEVDSSLLGGIIIRTPREELDASVRRSLSNLKASKIKE